MIAYIQTHATRHDGTRDSFLTVKAPARETILPWQAAGLTYTASGYGRRIPTRYMVRYNERWRRVYACQISNAGTLYIGKLSEGVIVTDIDTAQ